MKLFNGTVMKLYGASSIKIKKIKYYTLFNISWCM